MTKFMLSAALAAVFAFGADIDVNGAFAKATAPNVQNSAAFMTITNNTDQNISLVSASNSVSKFTELHTHVSENGMKKMIQIPQIDIPAKSSIELKPGGLHIMMIGLSKAVNPGDKVDLTLNFSNGKSIDLKGVEAKKLQPMKK
ncbi:Copper metallochaperone%2C bacterial analog of Cox17 protein [Campylobacter hyointestinalis]|uniref:copper chaperone PCu(A)C n=1 Tax=Campylobacter hyointestinalis TaxID=198 RepID=UPI000727036E|nr:copper chaperone PCu(A)C [Campylobacter hyointestinalis]CUU71298.1 Copper metallochaperone%2C bacterial analog of Cox17 protein [Campylobacter hyointestinalis]